MSQIFVSLHILIAEKCMLADRILELTDTVEKREMKDPNSRFNGSRKSVSQLN